jgi:transglutaminase-like putative cysteine protease
MSILKVHHRTTYRYSESVGFGEHRWMFRPRDSQEQRLILAERRVTPDPADISWVHDVFNNQIALVGFDITLEHTPQSGLRFDTDDAARIWPFTYEAETLPDIEAYRAVHYPDPSVESWAKRLVPHKGTADTAKLLLDLTHAVADTCSYSRRADPGTQPPALTLERKRGTCRDFTLLMMEAARILGFAARFVTGYIYVPARDEGRLHGGGATHAWVQIFLPGAGWVEFDPTNGIIGDPSQARPLAGSFRGDRNAYLGMEVDVLVSKLVDNTTIGHDGATVSFRG